DAAHRLDPGALREALATTGGEPEVAPVVVATAGTTEFGSIDPLPELASIAAEYGAWLHVDAAYGGGALFSPRLSGLLDGIAAADSVSLDFHKFGWLPIAAGVFLARDRVAFAPLARTVDYLNSSDDEEEGFDSLLGFSLRTTRRADAVKLATALLALGRAGFGELVDRCHDIATYAAEAISAHPRLRLVTAPVLTTVVFSYDADPGVNPRVRRRLLEEGSVIVGRAQVNGHPCLKLTFLNPQTDRADVDHLVEAVAIAGSEEDR
ncbi:MAG TPA: pyridoxal-dependent decarboxylase, partial [Actinopolymorphaceae bacterium]